MRNNVLLDIKTVYYEPAILDYPRGREILAQHPEAERIEIASHWNIPELHGNEELVEDWNKVKRTVLVLGVKKTVRCTPFYRSCDFIAPSIANGCAMACVYCVARGTLIATPRGSLPIECLREGDGVLSYDTTDGRIVEAPITTPSQRDVSEVFELHIGGITLLATAEHPILTRNGWVQVEKLCVGEEVRCHDSNTAQSYRTISGIEHCLTPTTVYNFHVPGTETYIANEVITHNCYVARRKGFANPITTFVNIEQICASIEKHANKQGPKNQPSQADPNYWVYEIGTNNDCSVDALISDNVKDLVALFRRLPNAKGTFASKFVNREMLSYDPQRKMRMRFSLMPTRISRVVDVRTVPIQERIEAINDFYEAGYELNLNFGPIIYYKNWLADYKELFRQIDSTISPQVKRQLQAEVIFLTHNEQLHEINKQWHPKAEALLWRPELQEHKVSQAGGGDNLRYKLNIKQKLVQDFRNLLKQELPYCQIRYAF